MSWACAFISFGSLIHHLSIAARHQHICLTAGAQGDGMVAKKVPLTERAGFHDVDTVTRPSPIQGTLLLSFVFSEMYHCSNPYPQKSRKSQAGPPRNHSLADTCACAMTKAARVVLAGAAGALAELTDVRLRESA